LAIMARIGRAILFNRHCSRVSASERKPNDTWHY
jgi:hypothetical protein